MLLNLTPALNPQEMTWSSGCNQTGNCSIFDLQTPKAKPLGLRLWQLFHPLTWHIDGGDKSPCVLLTPPPDHRHSPVQSDEAPSADGLTVFSGPLRKQGPVLSVKTWQRSAELWFDLFTVSGSLPCLTDCWITSIWNINIPQALWNNFTLQRNMTFRRERSENVLEAIYTPTWRDSNVILCPNETQIWVLSAFWSWSEHRHITIPEPFLFCLRTAAVAAQEGGHLHRLIAAETGLHLWTVSQTTSYNDFPVKSLIMMWANAWSLT